MEPAGPAGADPESTLPRAYLMVGGATLARHQLAVALAAGCERVACIGRYLDHEMIALQHEVERAGARFHLISGTRALSGLVTATDELLILAEGVVPNPVDAVETLGQTPSVLVLPAETAVPRGFERVDINSASAGLMLLPGRLVERLTELPADVEPVSALLRIALQSGVAQKRVPPSVAENGHWLLVRNEDEAHLAEQAWMERHTSGRGSTPGKAIAAFGVRHFGPALLHAGSGSRALTLAAMVLLVLAAGTGWFGFTTIALLISAPAWLSQQAAIIIERIQSDALGRRPGVLASEAPFTWLLDTVISVQLILSDEAGFGEVLWRRAFAPFVLFALLAFIPRHLPARWASWLRDRMLLALLLCGLSAAGALAYGVPALVAVILLAGLAFPGKTEASEMDQELTRA